MEINIHELNRITKNNAEHIKTMNSEMGELRDEQKETNKNLGDLKEHFTAVKTDVSWLKRFFWIVATASVGSLIAGLVQLARSM